MLLFSSGLLLSLGHSSQIMLHLIFSEKSFVPNHLFNMQKEKKGTYYRCGLLENNERLL